MIKLQSSYMGDSKRWQKPLIFLKETRSQLKKVTWPTRREAVRMTMTVIGISLLMAVFIGSLDFIFTKLTGLLIK